MQTTSKERVVIAPASIPQSMFMTSDADITIASGSAGSSKSYSILLRFMRFIHDPGTRGIIFRRTNTQLDLPNGLWSQAIELYSQFDPKMRVRQRDKELIFSTGARLKFSHFENEASKVKFKGLQADYIAFDESTEFTEEMVTYLMSRLRNANVKHKPSMCMATNPDYDSFLRTWIDWWLDPITGIPDPQKRGVKRWFVRKEGDFIWYDTKEEAEAIHGTGEDNGVMSMMVIGSTCEDNPYVPKSYVSNLKSLSAVEVGRLLYGSWYVRAEASGHFKKAWVEIVKNPDGRAIKRVRAYDLAATIPSDANKSPDWTAGVLMSRNKEKYYTVEHVLRFQDRFAGVEKRIIEQAYIDGQDTLICLPKDPGASASSYARSFQAKLAELGFTVKLITPKLDKVTRFGPFSAMAEAGFIRVVDGEWNKAYFDELEGFTGERKNKDDQVDATSDAFNQLRTSTEIPHFILPDMTQANKFANPFY